MRFLLDTDHISILQGRAGPDRVVLAGRIAAIRPEDLAFSVVSFHDFGRVPGLVTEDWTA